ncbi:MAG: crosslink repair DNA glycosylase YcaQ family protein [Pseudomonadota bacterium]
MTARLKIDNQTARALWLHSNGLLAQPGGPFDVMDIIRRLGFVQIDTIRNVTRAHHHILWSRNRNYREKLLWPLLQRRELFEHFTHDASLIPMEVLTYWQRQFKRLGEKAASSEWYKTGLRREDVDAIKERIRFEGPLSTHAFETKAESREMWARPPHKKALDQMWYSGELATCHRENFVKFYDLGERVFPSQLSAIVQDQEAIQWLCEQAMDRLSFATCGEVQRFWGAMNATEAKRWHIEASLIPLQIKTADGNWHQSWGAPDIEDRLKGLQKPATQLRLLNPFDPAIRDRARLLRLFGFEYRNEMFVPKAERLWGYYVYPIIRGLRFVARIELKADRAAGWMSVTGFWPERGTRISAKFEEDLERELRRFARLAGVTDLRWDVSLGEQVR